MSTMMGKPIGQIGFGLMGLSWRSDPPPLEQAIETLEAAYNHGSYLWNGGEFYGTPEYNSMTILKRYFEKHPEHAEKVVIIIKGGTSLETPKPDGSPENIRRSIDSILAQLGGTKKLDMFSIARRDHSVPWDVTLSVVKEYIDAGKIGGYSLSECSADTIEQTVKILPVLGAEVELSMFTPDILKNGIAAACAKHNIPIVAYSPLGRGILTGQFKKATDIVPGTVGSRMPRLQGEAFEHNMKLVKQLETLAEKKACSTGQLAIAWTVALGKQPGQPHVIPIPGASSVKHAEENLTPVELTEEEYKTITEMVDNFETAGARYGAGVPINT